MASASGEGSTVGEGDAARSPKYWTKPGGVLTTVIAAVAGILGIVGGAWFTADRDDQRSERDFWRAERTELYADYLEAVDKSRLLMEPFLPSPWDWAPDPSTLDEFSAVADDEALLEIQNSNREMTALTGRMDVIGGDAASLAQDLEQDLHDSEYFIEAVRQCQADVIDGWACDAQVGDLPQAQSIDNFLLHRDKFVSATQEQLQASD